MENLGLKEHNTLLRKENASLRLRAEIAEKRFLCSMENEPHLTWHKQMHTLQQMSILCILPSLFSETARIQYKNVYDTIESAFVK